jgi:hypothetical protein
MLMVQRLISAAQSRIELHGRGAEAANWTSSVSRSDRWISYFAGSQVGRLQIAEESGGFSVYSSRGAGDVATGGREKSAGST